MSRCRASEILRSETYFLVRRSDEGRGNAADVVPAKAGMGVFQQPATRPASMTAGDGANY